MMGVLGYEVASWKKYDGAGLDQGSFSGGNECEGGHVGQQQMEEMSERESIEILPET
jgi:hypothetical protein